MIFKISPCLSFFIILPSPADEAPDKPLADWEQAWLAQKAEARRRREEAIARGEYQD